MIFLFFDSSLMLAFQGFGDFWLLFIRLQRSASSLIVRSTVSANFHLQLFLTVSHLWIIYMPLLVTPLLSDKVLSILVPIWYHAAWLLLYQNTILTLLC